MNSKNAMKVLALILSGRIKSNAAFWREFPSRQALDYFNIDFEMFENTLIESGYNIVCAYDEDFPTLPYGLRASEKPFFFVYKGDISLLQNKQNNIAVIGTRKIDESIAIRERELVAKLTEKGFNIVSGLALGCDTVAHETCINCGGKTIAILPCTLDKIYPPANKQLAERIVNNGGLIITEYILAAYSDGEFKKRFVERDRLQAMFSSAVVLTASNRLRDGDCVSRHAINKSKEYGHKIFVMYDENKGDNKNLLFGLNTDLLADNSATILTDEIMNKSNN